MSEPTLIHETTYYVLVASPPGGKSSYFVINKEYDKIEWHGDALPMGYAVMEQLEIELAKVIKQIANTEAAKRGKSDSNLIALDS